MHGRTEGDKFWRGDLVQASQKMTNSLMLTTCMMNIGTLFSVSAMATAATASFVGASAFGLISLINFVKVRARLCSRSPCAEWMTEKCISDHTCRVCPVYKQFQVQTVPGAAHKVDACVKRTFPLL